MRPIAPGVGVLLGILALAPLPAEAALRVVLIEGLGGEPVYTQQFDAQAHALVAASQTLTGEHNIRVFSGAAATRAAVLAYFHTLAGTMASDDRLILYLIGHGSFDGRQYKFNIAGPDLSDHDIATMLDALPGQRQLIVATGSSSGALLTPLRRPQRVLITATRSGDERNATQFGTAFTAALASPAADANKNAAISAQEAYNFATRQVQDYFRHATLLASEHAVLQGDDAGTFTVAALKPTAAATSAAGNTTGSQAPTALTRRHDELNARIESLEQRKGTLPAAQYSAQLEQLLVELSQVQERIDQSAASAVHPDAAHAHR